MIYIQGKSKKAINEKLAAGQPVHGMEYDFFTGDRAHTLNGDVPKGTVIKIFGQYVGGNPYAKSYGTWDPVKNRIK